MGVTGKRCRSMGGVSHFTGCHISQMLIVKIPLSAGDGQHLEAKNRLSPVKPDSVSDVVAPTLWREGGCLVGVDEAVGSLNSCYSLSKL